MLNNSLLEEACKLLQIPSEKNLCINDIVDSVLHIIITSGLSMQSKYISNLRIIVIGDWISVSNQHILPEFCIINATPEQKLKAAIITIKTED